MIITIKSLPESKNVYGKWCYHKQARYRKQIEKEIFYEGAKQKARAPREPFERARITFKLYFKTKQRKDAQNYTAGGLIAVTDSLVSLGYIKDDNYDRIGYPRVWLEPCRDNPRTEIVIEEVKYEEVPEELFIALSDPPPVELFLKKELNAREILKYGRCERSFNWYAYYIEVVG